MTFTQPVTVYEVRFLSPHGRFIEETWGSPEAAHERVRQLAERGIVAEVVPVAR